MRAFFRRFSLPSFFLPTGKRRWHLAAAPSLVLAIGVASWAYFAGDASSEVAENLLVHQVARAEFVQDVVERGELSSSSNVEVRCEVKSPTTTGTTILWIVPEGTYVHKGDVIVRLDSSTYELDLTTQKIAANASKALAIQSKNAYELAVLARKQYLDGDYRQLEETAQSAIFVAEENVRRAEQVVEFSKKMRARGYISGIQVDADRYSLEKAKMDLKVAKTAMDVLRNYTREKTLKQLESDIKTAEAKWLADQNTHELDLQKLAEIEEQVAKCEIRAPQDGQVVYANREGRGDDDIVIEEGAIVRERQAIIFLPDPKRMQVDAKINEARVGLVDEGQPVAVQVDALPGRVYPGRVMRVADYPEPQRWSSSAKEYEAVVEIIGTYPELRPGLTAQVQIHVAREPDVLQVPVQAVVERNGQYFCLVRTPRGLRAQPVSIGRASDKFIVVEDGLSEADRVAVNPRQFLDLVELPPAAPEVDPRAMIAEKSDSTTTENHAPGAQEQVPEAGQDEVAAADAATSAPGPTSVGPQAKPEANAGR